RYPSDASRLLFNELLLHPYAAPRGLHSFPTRRSSDLSSSAFRQNTQSNVNGFQSASAGTYQFNTGLSASVDLFTGFRRTSRRTRSEEHTSELQSRFDLVCRLLLEKKKRRPVTQSTQTL